MDLQKTEGEGLYSVIIRIRPSSGLLWTC